MSGVKIMKFLCEVSEKASGKRSENLHSKNTHKFG